MRLLIFVSFLLPVLLAFRHIFLGKLPTWGDAPYFYPEGFDYFYSKLSIWTYRGQILGGVNNILWLYPIMFFMGFLHKVFSLGNDAIMRLIFYFPSVILSGLGSYLFARYLKLPRAVSFFTPFLYIFNTYFLLIIDGGQVGVALAYGFFPFVTLLGKKLLDKPGLTAFVSFVAVSFLTTIVDPRICLVAFLLLFIWQVLENWKRIWLLVIGGLILVPLNFYWLIPLLKIGSDTLSLDVTNLQLSSLLSALLLYSPHWPGNLFGKVVQPLFIFALTPFLLFGSLVFKKSKKILIFCLLFLVFSFISKGSTPPLGNLYDLITKLPFGFIFRDSSKFFIPLILIGGVLIGETVDVVKSRFKGAPVIVYLYLLFLISSVFLGKLNFILSNRKVGSDFQIIYKNINEQNMFSRTLWFPERHPLAYESITHPTADARDLVRLVPIRAINASEDVFNFLNNPDYIKWLRIFGFKYLILSGDPRNPKPNPEDVRDWNTIESLVAKTPGLKKLDWGTSFPIYEIPGNFPKNYFVKDITAVVGPFVGSTQTTVYFEDGILDPYLLVGKNPDSIKIYFNNKKNDDFTMSFLQKYFVSPSENVLSDWVIYGPDQNLKAKYELLIRGFEYKDLDYQKGIALSTQKGEKIKFKFDVVEVGDHLLAKRVANKEKQGFIWKVEKVNLKKGVFESEVENISGFEVLNTIALIPINEWDRAEKVGQDFLAKFKTVNESSFKDLEMKDIDLKYGYWQILNESYHPIWKSVPIYSTINGIYNEREN